MANYNTEKLQVTDTRYEISINITCQWNSDFIAQWDILLINSSEHFPVMCKIKWGEQPQVEGSNDTTVTLKGEPKYTDLNGDLKDSSWASKDKNKENCKIYQEYEIVYSINTECYETLGYIHAVDTKNKVTAGLIWTCHKRDNEYYWHVTEISRDSSFTVDIENKFNTDLKMPLSDKKGSKEIMLSPVKSLSSDISNYNVIFKIDLEKTTAKLNNKNLFKVTKTTWNEQTRKGECHITYEALDQVKSLWTSDFVLQYESQGNSFNDIETVQDFLNNCPSIVGLTLESLENESHSVLKSVIEENNETKYYLKTDTATGIPGEKQLILFKFKDGPGVIFNHYDSETINNWTWTHNVGDRPVEEKITVSNIRKELKKTNVTCELWYKLVLEGEKSLILYQTSLEALKTSPDAVIEGQEVSEDTQNTSTEGVTVPPENSEPEKEEPRIDSSAGDPNLAGGNTGTPETPSNNTENKNVSGGRKSDVNKLQASLKAEKEKVQKTEEKVKQKIQNLKNNEKVKEAFSKASKALEIASKTMATFEAFKTDLLSGITQATSLASESTEVLIKKLEESNLGKKLNKFKEDAEEVKKRFEGQLRQSHVEYKNDIIDILKDIRSGEDQVVTRINKVQEKYIMNTRSILEKFTNEIEDKCNAIVDAVNMESMGKVASETKQKLAKATKKVKDEAEKAQQTASLIAEAKIDQLMSKLKAMT